MNIKTGSVTLELSMNELLQIDEFIKKNLPDPMVPPPCMPDNNEMYETMKKLSRLLSEVKS